MASTHWKCHCFKLPHSLPKKHPTHFTQLRSTQRKSFSWHIFPLLKLTPPVALPVQRACVCQPSWREPQGVGKALVPQFQLPNVPLAADLPASGSLHSWWEPLASGREWEQGIRGEDGLKAYWSPRPAVLWPSTPACNTLLAIVTWPAFMLSCFCTACNRQAMPILLSNSLTIAEGFWLMYKAL